MQTTLLGLAIALILALLAALVGPFLIDWNQFRAPFETEASRLLGAPVRVAGALDARLLPTPSLRLRDVTVGGANDPGRVQAQRLDVEFSLGSLMRGEWRADELTINGVSLDLGLDSKGQLDWSASGLSSLAALTVDRLNLTGRIALHDAASRSTLELSDIAFAGELKAQPVSLRGDGNFRLDGSRYPFRLSTNRSADGNARLRLSFDSAERGISADIDGLITLDRRSPHFDGAVTLAGAASATTEGWLNAGQTASLPWRATAKVQADPAAATCEQLEATYGEGEKALKLSGRADIRFGAAPRIEATLAAKQLDVDRLLAKDGDQNGPAWLGKLRDLLASLPQPPLPARITLGTDQIMIGGRAVTDVTAVLRSDAGSLVIEQADLRAPGGSHLVLSGGNAVSAQPQNGIKGSLVLDAGDPAMLAAWLQGRAAPTGGAAKPLKAQGDISVSEDHLAVDRLKLESDSGNLQGHLAYRAATPQQGSHLDLALAGDSADLDIAKDLVRALLGDDDKKRTRWPDAADLDLQLGRAVWSGQNWQPLSAHLRYGPDQVVLERFKTGIAGVMLEGRATLDRRSAVGDLSLTANAPSFVAIADALSPFSSDIAARLKASSNGAGPAQARLTLQLDPAKAKGGQVQAAATLGLDAPQLSGSATFEATAKATDIKSFDLDALAKSEVTMKAALAAPQAQTLLRLAGLEGAVSAGAGEAKLDLSGTGRWRGAMQLKAHLAGSALDLAAEGQVEPWAAEAKAALMVQAPKLDLSPLLGLDPQGGDAGRISLASRLNVSGQTWTFNDIDAGVGDGRMRGRLVVTRGDQPAVEGEAGFDSIPLGPAFQLAIGAAGRDRDAPLGRGWTSGWRGKVAVHALTADLPGGAKLQPLDGVLRSDGQALTLETNGKIGGGEASATLTARPSDGGLALTGKVSLKGADGSALRDGDLVMPAGKATLQASLASTGRSGAALMGALSGGGTLTLDHAELPGLGPKAFEVAIAAGDAGQAIDDRQLSAVVEPALADGKFALDNAQFPLSLSDGRLSVAATTLQSQGVRAVLSGGYDIPAGQADLRATLTMADAGAGTAPEIRIFAAGPPDRLVRTVDLSALSSWLAVRRIDRETKKLQALERQSAPANPQVPADTSLKAGLGDSGRPHAVAPESAKPESSKPEPAPPSQQPAETPKPDAPKPDAKAAIQPPAPIESPTSKSDSAKDDPAIAAPPLPDADPRRAAPKPRPQPPRVSPPAASNSAPHPTPQPNPAAAQAARDAPRERAAPLPPPLEIRPAPGDARPTRLRPPVNLAPAPSPY